MNIPANIKGNTIYSLRSIFFTVIGILFAIIGLQGFLIPNNFLDGGVTGISILFLGISNLHISILLLIFNLPFVIIGFKKIGSTFGIHAMVAILMLAAGMYFVEINIFTQDKVLIAVFGGLFLGFGIGLVIKGGGVIDGLEVIARYTEEKSAFTSAEIILAFNVLIILGAAYQFGSEAGMYSILVYYMAMKTTNFVVYGFEEFTVLNIISKDASAIQSLIVKDFGKGITVFKGERGYLPGFFEKKTDCDIIMTVVTRLEVHKMKNAIMRIDPQAFIYINSIKEIKGGVLWHHHNGQWH